MDDYPGPFCQEYGLSTTDLSTGVILNSSNYLKTGLVLELKTFVEENGNNSNDLYSIITQLNPAFSGKSAKYLDEKIS